MLYVLKPRQCCGVAFYLPYRIRPTDPHEKPDYRLEYIRTKVQRLSTTKHSRKDKAKQGRALNRFAIDDKTPTPSPDTSEFSNKKPKLSHDGVDNEGGCANAEGVWKEQGENETVKNVGKDQDDELDLEGRVLEKIGAALGEEGIQDEGDEAVMESVTDAIGLAVKHERQARTPSSDPEDKLEN
jgi:hypothetical protein